MLAVLGIGWLAGKSAAAAANAVFSALAAALGAAANWMFTQMVHAISATTSVDLGASWFSGPGSPFMTMREIAIALAAPILIIGVLQSLLRNQPAEMLRRALLYPALAAIGTLVVGAVTSTLLSLTDQFSNALLSSAGADMSKFALDMGLLHPGGATPVFVVAVMATVTLFAAFFIWLELVVRAGAVYVAVLFFPLGMVGLFWSAAAHTAKRLAEFLVSVIASKLVIAAVIATGAALLGAPSALSTPGADIAHVVEGIALLGLAGFAPVALMRWVPIAEGAIVAHGLGRSAISGGYRMGKEGYNLAGSSKSRASEIARTPSPGGAAASGAGPGGAGGAAGAAAAAGPAAAVVVAAKAGMDRAKAAGTEGVASAAAGAGGAASQAGGSGTRDV